jgi:hypothetical protein
MDMRGHNSGGNPGNWIAVSRDMRDHPIVGMGQPVAPADPTRGSYSRYEAWQDLLMEAAYKPFEVLNRGKVVSLKRGQLMAARSWLAARWNWSEKTVRVFISRLEEELMIRSDSAAGRGQMNGRFNSILSICNYDIYQTVYELMKLSEETERARSGPDEGPDERPVQGPDEFPEKPLKSATILKLITPQGPDERPVQGPDKGPENSNNRNNLEREGERANSEGTRLPENWYLPNEWGQWAMHSCKRDREWVVEAAGRFKDYWLSVPDSKGFKKNWRSTWQNWCRNTLTREGRNAEAPPRKGGWPRANGNDYSLSGNYSGKTL